MPSNKVKINDSKTYNDNNDKQNDNLENNEQNDNLENNEQNDNQESKERKFVDFTNIGLDVVLFDRKFSRCQGTVSQIVKSLEDMIERLSKPENEYQNGLYPQIQKECRLIVQKYNDLLNNVNKNDYYVFGFYLNGPKNNGKRKATTTRHERKSYGVSEYKETIKSINDRLRHIKIDCKRKCHDSTRNNHDVFKQVIQFCDEYHQVIEKNE